MILNHAFFGHDVVTGQNNIQDLLTDYDKVEIYGGSVGTTIDKLWGRNIPLSYYDISHFTSSNYFPSWTPETYMYAEMEGDFEAGNIKGLTERIEYWNIYRQEVEKQDDGTFTTVGKFIFLDRLPRDVKGYTDYTAVRQRYYRYYLFAQTGTQYSIPAILPEIQSEYYGYFLIDMETNQTFKIDIGVTGGDQTINMKYSQYDTNTKYNAIQTAVTNFKSGTVGGLLIDNNDRNKFTNSIELLDSFRDFIYRDGVKYLKTRKGEIFNVFLSDYNETLIQQGIKNQPMVSNFNWREIDDVLQPNQIQKARGSYVLYMNVNYKGAPSLKPKYIKLESAVGILPVVERTGYTFNGWFTMKNGGSKVISTTVLSGYSNKVIYAQWSVNSYTIVYNGNKNTGGSMPNKVVEFGEKVALDANAFTRTSYVFKEWNTMKNGGGIVYDNFEFVKDLSTTNGAIITLYAQWKEIVLPLFSYNVGKPVATDVVVNIWKDGLMEFVGIGDTISGSLPLWYDNRLLVKKIKFEDTVQTTNMDSYFKSFINLIEIESLPSTITSMIGTCMDCRVLTKVPPIPDGVITMLGTFQSCYKLELTPLLPNSVNNMNMCFAENTNLRIITNIPNKLSTLSATFRSCANIIESPRLPETIVDANGAFEGCTSMKVAPNLPLKLARVSNMFKGCINLITPPPIISEYVTNADSMYESCYSLTGNMMIKATFTGGVNTYSNLFKDCSTNTNTNLIIDYTSANASVIDTIIATKSINSNITKIFKKMLFKSYDVGVNGNNVVANLYTDGQLEFEGSGFMKEYSSSTIPYKDDKPLIKKVNCKSGSTIKATDLIGYFGSSSEITDIDLSLLDVSNTTDMRRVFSFLINLVNLDLSNWNVENVTTMQNMLSNCRKLININISNWNTKKLTDISGMFDGCYALTNLDLSMLDVSNVISMYLTFDDCKELVNLNLSNWNTAKVMNMSLMFYGCSSLINLDLSMFDYRSVTTTYIMFADCKKLVNLNLGNFNIATADCGSMFTNCVELVSLGTNSLNLSKPTKITGMFRKCYKLTTKIIFNIPHADFSGMFEDAATIAPARIEVMYDDAVTNIDAIIATKSATSNVVKVTLLKKYNVGYPVATDVVAKLYNNGLMEFNGSGNTIKITQATDFRTPWVVDNNYMMIREVTFQPSVLSTDLNEYFDLCENLTYISHIPKTVTEMRRTFMYCRSLLVIPPIPSGVTIMTNAFYECISITSAPPFPENVVDVEKCYENCYKLVTPPPVLPKSIKVIDAIFQYCNALSGTMLIRYVPPESGYLNLFQGCSVDDGAHLIVNYTSENANDMERILESIIYFHSNVTLGVQVQ